MDYKTWIVRYTNVTDGNRVYYDTFTTEAFSQITAVEEISKSPKFSGSHDGNKRIITGIASLGGGHHMATVEYVESPQYKMGKTEIYGV